LKNICRDDAGALDALDTVCQRGPGAPENNKNAATKTNGENRSICIKDESPKRDRSSQRLKTLRTKSPDLHKKYVSGKLNLHQACIKAGVIKKRVSISTTDPESALQTILKHCDADFMARFRELFIGLE